MAEFPLVEGAYFMRRLAATRRAQSLAASIGFDLARSPLTDTELEEALSAFGAPKAESGWGFSEVFRELTSAEPKRFATSDLRGLQSNLIAEGYVPPGTPVDGVWTDEWYAAFRRFDRDNFQEFLGGKHWLSVPVSGAIRAVTNTIPSRVFQGVVGAARGFVEQTPESLERLGAVGGAAAGAAFGGIIGGPPGAVIGAIGGGILGFLGDLLGSDEGEESASTFEKIVDPFVPQEWASSSQAFFEDLGWVATGASLLSGAKLAYTGTKAGLGAIGAARMAPGVAVETPATLAAAPGGGFVGAAAVTEPGSLLRAALLRTPAQEPGWFVRFAAAASKPLIGPNRVASLVDWTRMNGLIARSSRPIYQTIRGFYTGAASGQLGGRLAAGFGSGETETTIEAAIEAAPELPDFVNWALWMAYPNQFFPFKLGSLGRSAERLMGDVSFQPYVVAAQSLDKTMGVPRARAWAHEVLGASAEEQAVRNTWLRVDYGLHRRAAEKVAGTSFDSFSAMADEFYTTTRVETIRSLKSEAAKGEEILASDLLSYSLPSATLGKGPDHYAAWLVSLGVEGRGLQALPDYIAAEELATKIAHQITTGAVPAITGQVGLRRVFAQTDEGLVSRTLRRAPVARGSTAAITLLREAEVAERQAKRYATLARRASDPATIVATRRLAEEASKKAAALRAQAERISTPEVWALGEVSILPQRLDTPSRSQLYGYAKSYRDIRAEVIAAAKASNENALVDAKMRLDRFLQERVYEGSVPTALADKASLGAKPSIDVSKHLEHKARVTAKEIDLPAPVMDEFARLGYRPVVTGEDVILPHQVPALVATLGPGEYTKRAAVWETIGFSPRWRTDRAAFALRNAHEIGELEQVLQEAGVLLHGREAMGRLYSKLEAVNHEGVVLGPAVVTAKGPRLYKLDVRQLTLDDITQAFEGVAGISDDVALKILGALKRGAAFGGELKFLKPADSSRALGRALRVNGLPGFSDLVRTWHTNPLTLSSAVGVGGKLKALRPVFTGAAAGAALAAAEGDEGVKDILKGAIGGAVVGGVLRAASRKFYGYLPDALVRANTALRYTLSFTFDAGRYTEQNSIAMAKFGLPMMWAPKKYIAARAGEFRSVYSPGKVLTGDEAWSEAIAYWDQVNGTKWFQHIDDTDRRMYQAGLLGFQPRNWEAAEAYLLKQRGWSDEAVAHAIPQIGRYGVGRTQAEKSANFIFFPFSFSKKLISTYGDFLIQAPVRALLLHEGMKRYHESSLDNKVMDFLERHLPLLHQLWRINNLSYGISPGRFFLEGLSDNRTSVGKVAQVLGSFFVPSGAATPIAQAAGGLGDLAVHAFVPIVVTGESINRAGGIDGLDDIISRYIPFVRDLNQYWRATGEEVTALTEGAAPFYQLSEYTGGLRQAKADLEPIAFAMGYTSAEGFLQSAAGLAFLPEYEQIRQDLQDRFPTGWRMTTEFENTAAIDAKAMLDLAAKSDPSAGEEAILSLAEQIETWRVLAEALRLSPEVVLSLAQPDIRNYALARVEDRRFAELYDRFFLRTFGPIRRIA